MYAKIFGQIHDSSIARPLPCTTTAPLSSLPMTRWIFEDMLKLANIDGEVDMTFYAISQRISVPEPIVREHVGLLEQPDPESRTPDFEGRRLVPLCITRSWGWRIVNFAMYRNMKCEEDRREQNRQAKRKQRSASVSTGQHVSALVSTCHKMSAQEDVELEVKEEAEENKIQQPCPNPPKAAGCGRDGDLKCRTLIRNGSAPDNSGSCGRPEPKTTARSTTTPSATCATTPTSPPESNAKDVNDGILTTLHGSTTDKPTAGQGSDIPRPAAIVPGDNHVLDIGSPTTDRRATSETLTVSGPLASDTVAATSTPTNPLHREVVTVNDAKALTPAERIYKAYPRKEGCAKAKIAIQKALKTVSFAELLEAVQAYAASPAGQRGQFVPHPATWFNQERWKDDRDNWERGDDWQDSRRNPPGSGGFQSGTQQAEIDAAWAEADARKALADGTGQLGPPEVLDVPY